MSFNKVILIGNVGRDPDVRHLPSGGTVANFSLATSDRAKDKNGNWVDQTEWHNIVCWGSNAEFAEKYIKKGSQIMVEGKIRYRQWQDQNQQTRYSTEINADNVRFVGRKSDNAENANYMQGAQSGNYQNQAQGQGRDYAQGQGQSLGQQQPNLEQQINKQQAAQAEPQVAHQAQQTQQPPQKQQFDPHVETSPAGFYDGNNSTDDDLPF